MLDLLFILPHVFEILDICLSDLRLLESAREEICFFYELSYGERLKKVGSVFHQGSFNAF